MSDSLCRVSVTWSGAMIDLALPRDLPLAVLVPDVVDIVAGRDVRTTVMRTWRLRAPLGDWLDAAMTLQECGVHDGDILSLSGAPAPAFVHAAAGPFRTVTSAEAPRPVARVSEAWAWCASVAMATLMCSFLHEGHRSVAAAVAVVTVVAAAVIARRAPSARLASCAVAVVYSAVAGYFVIGTSAHMSNVLLGSTAAAVSSVALLRLTSCGTTFLTACATYALLVALAVSAAVIATAGTIVVAAILILAALITLGLATRLVIVLTGLAPAVSGSVASVVTDRRAEYARGVMAGIVSGSAAAAATGCGLLAIAWLPAGSIPSAGPMLPAAVAGVLFLRSRLYSDTVCRIALGAGGLLCATSASAILVVAMPAHAGWLAVTTVGVVGGLYAQRHAVSPSWARSVDVLEGALLVSVIPLAGWASGLFGLARNMNMPW